MLNMALTPASTSTSVEVSITLATYCEIQVLDFLQPDYKKS